MATTGVAIHALLAGLRNTSTGASLASGKARFYQPDTLVARDVFSDDACTTAITQPYTLGSGGEAKLFMLEPVRMIVKDSSDSTTHWDVVLIQRHDQTYITHASINGGAETTLENFLTTATTSLGVDFQYKESSAATARNYADWLGEDHVSVKDFGALGDDNNDDTAEIQAAVDRVKDRGGGVVKFPKGTYRTSSAIAVGVTSSYIGVSLEGTGEGPVIIKQTSTTANGITVNVGSATDCKVTIKDITITASTTSSGKAIEVTNGDRVRIENVHTRLFRTGIDVSAVSGAVVKDCVIESTDDNASAVGITAGARGRVVDCEVISSTDNGSGIVLGADACARGCYTSNFATALLMSGARSHASEMHFAGATTSVSITGTGGSRITNSYINTATTGISLAAADACADGCVVVASSTGISLGAARTMAHRCVVSSNTTGISVGAFANCSVVGNNTSSNTTDISVNSSATSLVEYDNVYTTLTDSTALGHNAWMHRRPFGLRLKMLKTDSSTTPDTFTPNPQSYDLEIYRNTATSTSLTIAATSTSGLRDGQVYILVLYRDTGTAWGSVTWNAQYVATPSAPSANQYAAYWLVWRATEAKWHIFGEKTSISGGSSVWD